MGPIGADETAIDVTDLKCTAGDVVCFDINPFYAKGHGRVVPLNSSQFEHKGAPRSKKRGAFELSKRPVAFFDKNDAGQSSIA